VGAPRSVTASAPTPAEHKLSVLSQSLALCFTDSVLRARLQGRAGPARRSEQRLPGALYRPASCVQSLTRTYAVVLSSLAQPYSLVRHALSGHVRLHTAAAGTLAWPRSGQQGPPAVQAARRVVRRTAPQLAAHHLALGAGRFYVFDNNSTAPMLDAVLDLVQAGVVEYHYLTAPLQQARPRATRRPRRLGNRAPGAATPPLRCLQTIALSRKGCSVSELSRRRATDGRAAAGRSCTCTTRAFSSTARATAGWPSSTRTSSSCCATRARRTCPRCWPSTSSSARLLSTGRRAARALPRTCACAGPSVALLSAMVFGRPPTLTACRVSHRGSCTTQIARCQGAAVVLIACCTIGGGAVGPRNAAGWQHAGGVPALPARAQPGQPARQGHREPGICAARGR